MQDKNRKNLLTRYLRKEICMNKSHWLSGSLIFVLEIAAFCTTIVHANIPIIIKNGKKYARTGITPQNPLGSKWLEIGMDNTQIAVDNKGLIYRISNGKILGGREVTSSKEN